MTSIPRRERYKLLTFTDVGSAVYNDTHTFECFLCGRRNHEAMATVTARENHLPLTAHKVFVCLLCLQRTIRVPAEVSERTRRAVVHERNAKLMAPLFAKIYSLNEWNVHPVFHRLVELHNAGSDDDIPRWLVSEAYSLSNVYSADSDLWQSYVWLKKQPLEIDMINVFGGVGGVWPTFSQREIIRAKRC